MKNHVSISVLKGLDSARRDVGPDKVCPGPGHHDNFHYSGNTVKQRFTLIHTESGFSKRLHVQTGLDVCLEKVIVPYRNGIYIFVMLL